MSTRRPANGQEHPGQDHRPGAPEHRGPLLDDPATLRAAQDDPAGFVEHDGLMVIDEVQLAPWLSGRSSALAADPNPPDAFIRGDYRRLRVGAYRVMYVVEDDIITIERVDLVI